MPQHALRCPEVLSAHLTDTEIIVVEAAAEAQSEARQMMNTKDMSTFAGCVVDFVEACRWIRGKGK